MRKCIQHTLLLAVLLSTLSAHAGMTVFVSPNGTNGYILEGDNIGDAQLVEVALEYDPSVLSTPQVSTQSGTVVDLYDATPGTLRFSIDRGENLAAHFEAQLTFDRQGDAPGGIHSVTGSTRDAQGKSCAADSRMNLASSPREETQASDAGQAAPATGGTPAQSEMAPSSAGPGDDPAETWQSVLQRFEEYRGEQGGREFAALFERTGREPMTQEPLIALSDGKTPVSVTLRANPGAGNPPDFLLSDATLVTVGKGEGGRWVITLLPNKATSRASLILSTGTGPAEVPLLVAPPVRMPSGINEKSFLPALRAYLRDKAKEEGRVGAAQRDALNEYVFSANFLANLEQGGAAAVVRNASR